MDSTLETTVIPDVAATSAVHREVFTLPPGTAGDAKKLTVLRVGQRGAHPKAYLQAGLHADELPGMLVLRELAQLLEEADQRGKITGEILLVPVANPLGGFGNNRRQAVCSPLPALCMAGQDHRQNRRR